MSEDAAAKDFAKIDAQSKKSFEDAIRAILTTFGVFTGFAIKAAIDEIDFPASTSTSAVFELLTNSDVFICIAIVALLLRFIIGSAVHLNLCYVTEPRSKRPIMLFKDVIFLILFGLAAVFLIEAKDVLEFAWRAACFILIGTLWSVVDAVVRYRGESGEKSLFSGWWFMIDMGQLGATWLVFRVSHDPLWQSILMAIVFSVALYGDMWVLLRPKKAAKS